MPPRLDGQGSNAASLRTSKAVALLRRSGTDPMMSLVKTGGPLDMASIMTRLLLRNIHLSLLSRKQENPEINGTENGYAPTQRDGEAPALKWVRIAVKPDMGPPATTAGDVYWFESPDVNYENSSKKWKGGLSAQTQKSKRAKKPPFVLKEVPYDEWRKHYAKDRLGWYRGTEAPAENCILLPEDEIKWRSETPQLRIEQTAMNEDDASPSVQELKRAVTFPELGKLDVSTESTEQEQAIFVAEDGHTDSRIVDEPHIRPGTQDAALIFISPPTSPIR